MLCFSAGAEVSFKTSLVEAILTGLSLAREDSSVHNRERDSNGADWLASAVGLRAIVMFYVA